MEKILTIVIPTYNMEKYLDKCLTSIIIDDKELMKQYEVIVVIDGAKDRSSEIAHRYQDRCPDTFIVIDKENGNYGSCINRGLKDAKGKYIKVLDADDSFDTENFVLYLQFLKTVDVDLVLTDYSTVEENKDSIINYFDYNIPHDQILAFENLCSKETLSKMTMHSITYLTDNLKSINYHQTEGISYTDQEWIFLPMIQVNKFVYKKNNLYKYLIGREGQTMDPNVLLRSISHTMKGVLTMASEFENLEHSIPEVKFKYLGFMLKKRCNYIYSNYLLSRNSLDFKELIHFDNQLRIISPKAYVVSSNCNIQRLGFIKYVKYWRCYQRLKTYLVHK